MVLGIGGIDNPYGGWGFGDYAAFATAASPTFSWFSPWTSAIADLPNSWATDLYTSGSVAGSFIGAVTGFGFSPAGWLAAAVIPWIPFVNAYRPGRLWFSPQVPVYQQRPQAHQRRGSESMKTPRWEEAGEIPGYDSVPDKIPGEAGTEEGEAKAGSGSERTKDPNQLTDPKYGAWQAGDVGKAKALKQAVGGVSARNKANWSIGVTFGTKGSKAGQVSITARPKSAAPTTEEVKKVRGALNAAKKRHGEGLEVQIAVTTTPPTPKAAGGAAATETAGAGGAAAAPPGETGATPTEVGSGKGYKIMQTGNQVTVTFSDPALVNPATGDQKMARSNAITKGKEYVRRNSGTSYGGPNL
ncbi:MAG: hypothetical protein HYV02_03810 [Deltaproteobacteria bacterium]|nr:hypothetical protein [Deltaproteobacteria bacterium]